MKDKLLYCLFAVLFLYSFSGLFAGTRTYSGTIIWPEPVTKNRFIVTLQPGIYTFDCSGSGNYMVFSACPDEVTEGARYVSSPYGWVGDTSGTFTISQTSDIYCLAPWAGAVNSYYTLSITGENIVPPVEAPVWSVNPKVYNYSPGGVSFTQNLNSLCSGSPTYTSSNLPSWLSISGSTLSGTIPTAAGTYGFDITATNSGGSSACHFSIVVSVPVVDPPVWSANPKVYNISPGGVPFSQGLTSICSGSPSFTSSNLPSWLTLSGYMLTGTVPTAAGAYAFDITATNSGGSAACHFVINVSAGSPPVWSVTLKEWDQPYGGQQIFFDCNMICNGATSYAGLGLPSWLSLSGSSIIGTTTTTPGVYDFNVIATNAYGSSTCNFRVVIDVQSVDCKLDNPASNNPLCATWTCHNINPATGLECGIRVCDYHYKHQCPFAIQNMCPNRNDCVICHKLVNGVSCGQCLNSQIPPHIAHTNIHDEVQPEDQQEDVAPPDCPNGPDCIRCGFINPDTLKMCMICKVHHKHTHTDKPGESPNNVGGGLGSFGFKCPPNLKKIWSLLTDTVFVALSSYSSLVSGSPPAPSFTFPFENPFSEYVGGAPFSLGFDFATLPAWAVTICSAARMIMAWMCTWAFIFCILKIFRECGN